MVLPTLFKTEQEANDYCNEVEERGGLVMEHCPYETSQGEWGVVAISDPYWADMQRNGMANII